MKRTILSIFAFTFCMIMVFSTVACKTKTTATPPESTSQSDATPTASPSSEAPAPFAISSNELALFVKESKVIYSNDTESTEWKSDNSDIAKIDDKGNVYALKKGSCVITADNGKGESAECKVTVYDPADYIKMPDIKTLTVKQSQIEKEISDEFKYMAEYFADKKEQDESKLIENDDIASISFSGVLDGETEPFEGGTGVYDLQIGSKSFVDGFEDGLIGHKTGETVKLDLTFPSDYVDPSKDPERAEKFNGKKVVFTVTINKVYSMIPAEITDDLISKATNDQYKTVEAYTDYIRGELKEYLAIEEVIAASEIKSYPDELVKFYNDIWINNKFGMYAQYYGMTPIQFACQYYGYTEEQLNEEATKNSKAYIEQLYVVYSIISQETFTVPSDVRDQILKDYAASGDFESVDELIKEAGQAHIENYVASKYAIIYIVEQVKTVDDTNSAD